MQQLSIRFLFQIIALHSINACLPHSNLHHHHSDRLRYSVLYFGDDDVSTTQADTYARLLTRGRFYPNAIETSTLASGRQRSALARDSIEFRRSMLFYYTNSMVTFEDAERGGRLRQNKTYEDHWMTKRCYDSLNKLALKVRMSVPGTDYGLRIHVIDAWEPYRRVPRIRPLSLHHEGRALDLTFGFDDERNRVYWPVERKLGVLALWAIQAGFDWVHYESRDHIHVSCRAESNADADIENAFIVGGYAGNCFPSNASVRFADGTRRSMDALRVGDRIATIDAATGQLIYSPILLFLDRSPTADVDSYRRITLSDRTSIHISADHLIYRFDPFASNSLQFADQFVAVRSRSICVGDRLLVAGVSNRYLASVVDVTTVHARGAFAPLTSSGTLIVDDVVVSCYASIDSVRLAHTAMAPVRVFDTIRRLILNVFGSMTEYLDGGDDRQDGLHIYAKCLIIFAESIYHVFGITF